MTTSPATHTTQQLTPAIRGDRHIQRIARLLRRKTFATLATVSPAGRPHSAGVVYVWADGALWVHTVRSSRKGRNIASSEHAAVTVPFRRLPLGPPYTIHFQATAELIDIDDPAARRLIDDASLKLISGHGALDEPDGVFARITPIGNVHSYGPGARTLDLMRDPLHHGVGITTADRIADVAA